MFKVMRKNEKEHPVSMDPHFAKCLPRKPPYSSNFNKVMLYNALISRGQMVNERW